MTMFTRRLARLFLMCAVSHLVAAPLRAAEPSASGLAPAPPKFSAAEQQARHSILTSEGWQQARSKFDEWLSVQSMYDAARIAAMKHEFARRIEGMSAVELQAFLSVMQNRLNVLLSADVTAARNWADEFYTSQGKQKLAEKHHIADPMSMTGAELEGALAEFASERQSQATAQAAFQKGQGASIAAMEENRKQQQAAAAAAPRHAASYGAPYAPTRPRDRPQRYEAPYNPVRYSVDPWGGVWIGH
jgi:hypothetical protein